MRVRRSLLNFGTTILLTGITMAVGLFASPRLEHWLGEKRFGAFRIILDCSSFLALLELGLGGALSPLLARALGRGDESALRRVMAVGVRDYFRLSLLTLAVGLALTPILPGFVSDLPAADVFDLRRAWLIGLIGVFSLALTPFRTVVEADQRGYWINLLLTVQSVAITAGALVLAWHGLGITGQALATMAGCWIMPLALTARVARREPSRARAVWAEPVDPATRRALWTLSVPTLLMNLCGRVSLMSDNLVIGGLRGASSVTSLYFTQRLVVLSQTLVLSVGNATWAALAELHARGDRETFNRRVVELSGLVSVLSVAGLGPIVAYNHHFVRLWVHQADFRYAGAGVVAVAAVNAFLQAQFSLWAWCFTATGQVRKLMVPSVAAAVVNLGASVAFTYFLGTIGPLLGTTLAFATVTLWYLPWRLRLDFGVAPGALARAVAVPAAWGLVYTGGLCWVARRHPPWGWLGLAVAMSVPAVGFLVVSGRFLLSPADRLLWRARLRGLWPAATPLP